MDSASDFESEGCGFDPHPRCFGEVNNSATTGTSNHIFCSRTPYTYLTVAQLVERGTVIVILLLSLGRWFDSVP